jgi:hypothetical protein
MTVVTRPWLVSKVYTLYTGRMILTILPSRPPNIGDHWD